MSTPELRALTGARGIAAWMVVLFHLRRSLSGLPDPVMAVLAKGYLAVDFFFLLSGFVIWLAWNDRFRRDGIAAIGPFLRKRVARVWPLHLFVLGGAVALALALLATGRHDAAEFPFAALPLHLLLVQTWGSSQTLAWNDPAWSISAEFAAYLAFLLLAIAVDWRRLPSWAIIAALVGLVGLLSVILALAGEVGLGRDIPRFGVLRCLTEFAAGTTVAALWLRYRGRRPAAFVSAAVALAAFVCFAGGLVRESLSVPIAFAALLLTLALTAGRRGNPLEGRIIHGLGEISYATYLGHYLLWFVFKLLFVTDARAAPVAVVALYLATVVVASILLYRHVERPAQAWINGTNRQRRHAAIG